MIYLFYRPSHAFIAEWSFLLEKFDSAIASILFQIHYTQISRSSSKIKVNNRFFNIDDILQPSASEYYRWIRPLSIFITYSNCHILLFDVYYIRLLRIFLISAVLAYYKASLLLVTMFLALRASRRCPLDIEKWYFTRFTKAATDDIDYFCISGICIVYYCLPQVYMLLLAATIAVDAWFRRYFQIDTYFELLTGNWYCHFRHLYYFGRATPPYVAISFLSHDGMLIHLSSFRFYR